MFWFVIKRLLGLIPLLALIVFITFLLMRGAPGSPFLMERNLPKEIEAELAARYHYNDPIHKQFAVFFTDLVQGKLPSTKSRGTTVNEIIRETLPISAVLGGTAFLIATIVGITLGMISAGRHHGITDYVSMGFVFLSISIPKFVLAPLLIILFSFKWKIDGKPLLPSSGWGDVQHIILPAILLALPFAAYIARLMRNGLLEALHHDSIRTARAKGIPESTILVKHAGKIAILPVVSFMGPMAAELLTGSFVIELIFNIPGLGRFFISAVLDRDANMVAGVTLLLSAMLLIFNLLVDIAYTYLDPRIRYE